MSSPSLSRGFRFVKMHGAGNDYVYVDAAKEGLADLDDNALADLARRVSDRHTGIGGDGLILVLPDGDADVRMRMFNLDGSEGEMCGNGVRCVAKFAVDEGLVHVDGETGPIHGDAIRVATGAGIRDIGLVREQGVIVGATVDMGEPALGADAVGLSGVDDAGGGEVALPGIDRRIVNVSTGNPHAVLFVDDLDAVDLPREGGFVSTHELFARGTNAHFVQVLSRERVRVAHWERGSGPTLACGTGACAVVVAGVVTGRLERDVAVEVPGGVLEIQWGEAANRLRMTGPAVTVFEGRWPG